MARLGARLAEERHFEDNRLFDDARRSLAARGSVLRLRRVPRAGLLTYKGPRRVEDGVRSRLEVETEVGDADAFERVLGEIGFEATFRYQKYREVWELGELELVVDETPIGTFVEIEGPAAAIHRAAASLGFSRHDYVLESYVTLFFAGGGRGEMTFAPGPGAERTGPE